MDETAAEPGAVSSGAADGVCLKVAACGGISGLLASARRPAQRARSSTSARPTTGRWASRPACTRRRRCSPRRRAGWRRCGSSRMPTTSPSPPGGRVSGSGNKHSRHGIRGLEVHGVPDARHHHDFRVGDPLGHPPGEVDVLRVAVAGDQRDRQVELVQAVPYGSIAPGPSARSAAARARGSLRSRSAWATARTSGGCVANTSSAPHSSAKPRSSCPPCGRPAPRRRHGAAPARPGQRPGRRPHEHEAAEAARPVQRRPQRHPPAERIAAQRRARGRRGGHVLNHRADVDRPRVAGSAVPAQVERARVDLGRQPRAAPDPTTVRSA